MTTTAAAAVLVRELCDLEPAELKSFAFKFRPLPPFPERLDVRAMWAIAAHVLEFESPGDALALAHAVRERHQGGAT